MDEVAQGDVLRAYIVAADDLGDAYERVNALLELLD